jgi:DNA segregation ATPase FtsK/SpoIIIE, S-DNA-T family
MPPSKRSGKRAQQPQFQLDPEVQRDIVAVALLVVAIFTAITLFFPGGELGRAWSTGVTSLFGWGSMVVAIAVGLLGALILRQSFERSARLSWQQTTGVAVLLLVLLGVLHVVLVAGMPQGGQQAAEAGGGGGRVGYAIGQTLISGIGIVGGLIVLAALGVLAALCSLKVTVDDIQVAVVAGRQWALDYYHLNLRPVPPAGADLRVPPPSPATFEASPERVESARHAPAAPAQTQKAPAVEPAPVARPAAPKPSWRLPELELLEASVEQELSQSDIRRRVKIIEETLASFNIAAHVVEVNQGPTVTQFGVQPAPGVTVNRIVARSNDLALALAAAPIRIEAPVPGKSVVGIEVPNAVTALVGLRGVIETSSFQRVKVKSRLAIALGQDVSGSPVCADLAKMPHLLIAGATGSGKTVCLNSIIACFLFNATPDEIKLLMVDPKMVELVGFNGIPHLIAPVVTDVSKVVNVLKWSTREMERRYKLFAASGARNIDGYNRLPAARRNGESLPFIVVIIDELADVMMMAPEETERLICRLAQMARATGIHLLIATQRPSVDVITGLIKANFPARISFAVTSQIDSRVVLDMAGAEKLLGRGDMLYMAPDSSKTVRLQGTWVSDGELEQLVDCWKTQSVGMTPGAALIDAGGDVLPPRPDASAGSPGLAPWTDETENEDADELLPQAVDAVRDAGRASASLLQRKLRIGYARAARLIDLMEEQGIIGGPADGGRAREVLSRVNAEETDS